MDANHPIRILFVEDVPADMELAERGLRKEGLRFTSQRVETEDEFSAALDEFQPDVVVSDYALPEFDGIRALRIALARDPTCPFIVLTGALNDETAVACIKAGATDYIIKERIARLPFAINEALRQREALRQKDAAEQALRASEHRFATIFRASPMGICLIGLTDGRIADVNNAFLEMVGYARARVVGRTTLELNLWANPEEQMRIVEMLRDRNRIQNFEMTFRKESGAIGYALISMEVIEIGDQHYVLNMFSDITARKQSEDDLKQRARQQAAVVLLGRLALNGADLDDLFDEAVNLVVHTLDVPLCNVLELLPDGENLRLRAGVGWQNGLVGQATVPAHRESQVGYALSTGSPLIVTDVAHETRFSAPPLLRDHQVVSGVSVVIDGRQRPSGVLGVHDVRSRTFGKDDVNFLTAIANVLSAALDRKHDDEALRKSEDRFRTMADFTYAWEYWVGPDRQYVYISPACERITGYRAAEFLNDPELLINITDAADRQMLSDHISQEFQTMEIATFDFRITTRTGEPRWINHFCQSVYGADGQWLGRRATNRDITDRKRSEAVNQAHLELLNFAVAQPIHAVLRKALDLLEGLTGSQIGFYHFVERDQHTLSLQVWSTRTEQEFCRAVGKGQHYPLEQAGVWTDCVRTKQPVIHNDYASLPHRKGLPEGHAPILRELVVPILRGEQFVAILGVGNKPTNYTAEDVKLAADFADLAWEIVDRKRAEEALRESENIMRVWLNAVQESAFLVDREGMILAANATVAQRLHRSVEELVGACIYDFLPPETTDARRVHLAQVIASGQPERFEDVCFGRVIDNVIYPVFDPAGQVKHLAIMGSDITERKQAEEALRTSEKRFMTIFQANPAAIAITRLSDNQFMDVNQAWQNLTGYTHAEAVGHTPLELNLWVNSAQRAQLIETLRVQGIVRAETQIRQKSGAIVETLMSAEEIELAGERYLLTMAQDITARKQAEEAIKSARAFLEMVIEMSPFAMWISDQDGMILRVNRSLCETIRLTEDEIVGKYNVFKDTNLEMQGIMPRVQAVFAQHTPIRFSILWKAADAGSADFKGARDLYLEASMFPILNAQGELTNVVCQWIDITERKHAEEEAIRAAQEWQTTFDATHDVLWILDKDHRVLRSNKATERVFHCRSEEVIGKQCCEIVHNTTQPIPECPVIWSKQSLHRETMEQRIGKQWFEVTIDPILDAEGRYDGAVHIISDITERKHIEEALRESEDKFKYMFDHSVIGKSITLPSGEMSVNNAFCKMLGYMPEEFSGKKLQDVTHPEDREQSQQIIEQLLSGQETSSRFTKRYLHKNGSVVWVDVGTVLRRDQKGTPLYFMTSMSDITEQKRAEEEIKWLNEFNESIIRNMQEGIAIEDAEGYFIFMNPAAAQILGYPVAELVGQHWSTVIPEDQQAMIRAADERRTHGESDRYEVDMLRKDGVRRSVLISGSPRFDRGRFVGTLAVFSDITERKHAEQVLQQMNSELEDRVQERTAQLVAVNQQLQAEIAERQQAEAQLLLLHNAVETTDVGVTITDIAGNIVYVNPTEAQMHGYAIADLIGQPARIFAPSELAHHMIFEQLQPHWERESLNRRQDGSTFPVHLVSTPVYDAAGNPAGVITVSEDITERKHIELELQRAKDAADAANRAKSEFLANMSHELRTPLNAILGYAQILQDAGDLPERYRKGLATIQRSGEHLLTLIKDILDLAKIEAGRLELQSDEVDFPEFLSTIVEMIRVKADQKGLALVYEPDPALPTGVCADEKRLREILLNLLGNAVKFTEQGTVTFRIVDVGCEILDSKETPQSHDAHSSNQKSHIVNLKFEIADTGIGITWDKLEDIFAPFQQTGDQRYRVEGTGLGLAISRRLVELMGGELQVESRLGEGSLFWFEVALPIIPNFIPPPSASRNKPRVTGYLGRRRRVLVIDDQQTNREVLLAMLEPLGFETRVAENGQQGVAQYLECAPDVILLDLFMPEMDGFEMAERIRALEQRNAEQQAANRHTVALIAISANASEEIRAQSLRAGCDDFLPKPFQTSELLERLAQHVNVEWVSEKTGKPDMPTPSAAAAYDAGALLGIPPDERCQLLQHAKRGDAKMLLAQLTRIEQEHPRCLPTVLALRDLARGFQVDRIVDMLEEAEERATR